MLEVENSILTVDPTRSKLALKMQSLAKKYKWVYESNPAPKAAITDAEYLNALNLRCRDYIDKVSRKVKSPIVPPRTSILCEICKETKPSEDMVIEQLAPDRMSWTGWCRSCTIERRMAV